MKSRELGDWRQPRVVTPDDRASIEAALAAGMPQGLATTIELLAIPATARGCTATRFRSLAEVCAIDLSLGRLVEGHFDALDILQAAGLVPYEGTYGVWAADPDTCVIEGAQPDLKVNGLKPYCSGATHLANALVAGRGSRGSLLVELSAQQGAIEIEAGTWPSIGMAASDSFTVRFRDAPVRRSVGGPSFYVERPGFWQGSLSVAACWFGGALGLAAEVVKLVGPSGNAHHLAAVGELDALMWSLQTVLDNAGDSTDNDPMDERKQAQARALRVRHLVAQGCQRVFELAGFIGGTHLAAHDPVQSRRFADLWVYLRQHHGSADLESLGRLLAESPRD